MAKALAKALEKDQLFLAINLSDCLLGDDGTIKICQALKNNSTIESLDLKGNNIRADATVALSQLLKLNSSLKSLTLEWNCIGIWENGINSLGDALSLNQSLEVLDLRSNKIGPQSAVVIATGLKTNTTLKRLDMRWNNIGIIGARGFLDCLKWNQSLLYLEVQGNDIPDDLLVAIGMFSQEFVSYLEMALERNRQHDRVNGESSQRAKYLSNTLQQLSVEHEESIQGMKARLLAAETEAKSLGQKLNVASDEIENGQMGYKVVETKLTEERARREMMEQKYADLETQLVRERKEFSEKCKEFMNDVIREREERRLIEEGSRARSAKEAETALIFDSKLKDLELRLERSQKDNRDLEKELASIKGERKNIEEDEVAEMRHKQKTQLIEVEHEWKSKYLSLSEQLKLSQEQIERMKQSAADQENSFKSAEQKIRAEEQAKAKDIIQRLQITTQQRDQLQNNLNMSSQQYKQTIADLEQRLQAEREGNRQLNGQLSNLSADKRKSEDELQKLHAIQSTWQKRQDDINASLERSESENQRLRDEVRHLREKLDKRRDDEVQRARELERAISSYVRSVEKHRPSTSD